MNEVHQYVATAKIITVIRESFLLHNDEKKKMLQYFPVNKIYFFEPG